MDPITNAPNDATQAFLKIRPTIIIGLGGSGGDVLMRIRGRFIERYGNLDAFPIVRYLWIDTDTAEKHESVPANIQELTRFTASEKRLATVTNPNEIISNPAVHSGITEWWYKDLNALGTVTTGAGQIRAYSRMGFFYNAVDIENDILNAYNKVSDHEVQMSMVNSPILNELGVANKLDFDFTTTDIVIVCSIAGGTGSGMLLDLAFMVKELLKAKKVQIIGHLIFSGHFGNVVGSDRIAANSYALLKELDYYQYGTHKFEASWDNHKRCSVSLPAFDHTMIYDNVNSCGKNNSDPGWFFSLLAESIFKDFTHGTFAEQKRSTRCNLIQYGTAVWTADMGVYRQNFNQHYGSAGFSSIIVPHHRMKAACAYRLAADTVDSWSGKKCQDQAATSAASAQCMKMRDDLQISDDLSPNCKKHDIMQSLYDPQALGERSRGANGINRQPARRGIEIDNIIASGKRPRGLSSLEYINNCLKEEKDKLRSEGDLSTWGDYFRIIHDNATSLIERICGSEDKKTPSALSTWVLSTTGDNDDSKASKDFRLMGMSLRTFSAELKELLEKIPEEQKKTLADMKQKQADYDRACQELRDLDSQRQGFFGPSLSVPKKLAVQKAIKAAFGMQEGQHSLLSLNMRWLMLEQMKRVLNHFILFVDGDDTPSQRRVGLIDRFAKVDRALDSLSERLRTQANYYAQKEENTFSLVLYEPSEFDSIYKRYTEGRNLQDVVTKDLQDKDKSYDLFRLQNDLQAGYYESWMSKLVALCRPHFSNISYDYNVLQRFFERFPDPKEWQNQLNTYMSISGYWVTPCHQGNRFKLDTGKQECKMYSLPTAEGINDPTLVATINGYRNTLKAYVDKANGGMRSVDVSQTDEIIFYQEVGGFPLNYVSSLTALRDEYLKQVANSANPLHTTHRDYIFRDPALLSPEEQKAAMDARRAFILGVALDVITYSEGNGYSFVSSAGFQQMPVNLKGHMHAITTLNANHDLCQEILSKIDEKLGELYLNPHPKDMANWKALLGLTYRDTYGENWGKIGKGRDSYLALEFNDMLEVQSIEQEILRLNETIEGNHLPGTKIKQFVDMVVNRTAKAETKFSRVPREQLPYPKDSHDGRRRLGHSPTAWAEAWHNRMPQPKLRNSICGPIPYAADEWSYDNPDVFGDQHQYTVDAPPAAKSNDTSYTNWWEQPMQPNDPWGQQMPQQQPGAPWGQQMPQQQPGAPWGQQTPQQQPGAPWGQQMPQQQPGAPWGQQMPQQQPGVPWGQEQPQQAPQNDNPWGQEQPQQDPQNDSPWGQEQPQQTPQNDSPWGESVNAQIPDSSNIPATTPQANSAQSGNWGASSSAANSAWGTENSDSDDSVDTPW